MIDFTAVASVADMLGAVAGHAPQRVAVVDHGRVWTYAQLDAHVSALAACLGAHGLQAGAACAVLMDNNAEHVAAHFAVMRAGGVTVPVNVRHHAREVAEQLAHSDATCLIVSPRFRPLLADWLASAPAVRAALVLAGPAAPAAPATRGAGTWVRLHELPVATGPLPTRTRSDPYVMWYTSGTTGKPKGVVHDNESGLAAMRAWIEVWQLGPADRTLVKNLYHVGMTASVMAFVAAGGSLAMMADDFSVARLLDDLSSQRVTFLAAAPAMLSLLLKNADLVRGHDLSALRLITCGSAPTDPTLFARIVALLPAHIRWTHSWGQTEVNTGGLCLAPEDFFTHLGSIGKPIGCVEAVSIRDPEGQALPTDAVGELCLRGPTVARGYHKETPAETPAEAGSQPHPAAAGWHRTGDLARVDAAGFYWLVGRKRDLIIRGGENIYPAEVERVLAEHPAVHESVLVGLPDTVMGEVPLAFVELRTTEGFDAAALRAWCAERLAAYKCPVHIEVVEAFPRNSLGKILREPLRARAALLAPRIGR